MKLVVPAVDEDTSATLGASTVTVTGTPMGEQTVTLTATGFANLFTTEPGIAVVKDTDGVDADSPWLRLTACAGRPGCASALADVQADAAAFGARWPDRIVHVSGCGRHCGRPAGTQVDVTATSQGYQVAEV